MEKRYVVEEHHHYYGFIGCGSGGSSRRDFDELDFGLIAAIVGGIILTLIFGKWIIIPYTVVVGIIYLRDVIPSIIQIAVMVGIMSLGNWLAGRVGILIAFVVGWIITSKVKEAIEDWLF